MVENRPAKSDVEEANSDAGFTLVYNRRARVWMLYEQRDIEAGRKYYEEWRQSVKFKRNIDDEDKVEIASADDVSPAVWSIKMLPSPLNTDEKHAAANFLRAHVEGGKAKESIDAYNH
jgi:hypothetical protein